MNPEDGYSVDDEASGFNEGTSSSVGAKDNNELVEENAVATTSAYPDMKRSAVKQLIERYFYQLQRGCGNPMCENINCASSGKVPPMTPNEMAAKSLQLFSQDAKLCDYNGQQPIPKIPRTQDDSSTSSQAGSSTSTSVQDFEMTHSDTSPTCSSSSSSSHSSSSSSSSSARSSDSTITTGSSTTTYSSPPKTNKLKLPSLLPIESKGDATASKQEFDATGTSPGASGRNSEPTTPTLPPVDFLDEQIVDELVEEYNTYKTSDRLVYAIKEVFGNVEKLGKSFCRPALPELTSTFTAKKLHELLGKTPAQLKKEDLRALEGENEKDEDSTCRPSSAIQTEDAINPDYQDESMDTDDTLSNTKTITLSESSDTTVDLESLRRVKKKLFSVESKEISEALHSTIITLTDSIRYKHYTEWDEVVHCLIVTFDLATTTSTVFYDLEYLERCLPRLCHCSKVLPVAEQARLARVWAVHCKDHLQSLVENLQQLITLHSLMEEDTVQKNPDVIAVTRVLKIAYYANILAGESEPHQTILSDESAVENEASTAEEDLFYYTPATDRNRATAPDDPLEKELNLHTMDCRKPLIPFEEFYNEPLSDAIQMDRDYLQYKNLMMDPHNDHLDTHFSFMLYSFVLTPHAKVLALYYDSRIRMYSERHSIYSLLNMIEDQSHPDLKLRVRRDHIIDDALVELEMIALSNPKHLKKQLVVEFDGEQGIDEGGVSKEFFQLIVEEIFNPDFGMFVQQEDTNTMWFNSTSFENNAQFTLIGIILGLAIYNNIILAVNFPMVVYRKLMSGLGTFYDLEDWNPTLYNSLKSMLDYEEEDLDEVFMQTFKISYKNVFGEVVDHELLPNGANIAVTQQNKQQFVDLYADFLLNKSVDIQFKAFKKGFEMVTDESPLKLLFRPEEIELLVCGCKKFDFLELERSTEYEGGYTRESQIIKDFWSIVHSMCEALKKKLLQFTTGSDRVPVGGLGRLKLLITRHGPDSDRLPTSHTCFNVLLLPEYSSKEKLEERLIKAINYSKGFGML